jgi:glucose/arabinose dehydrogenase
MKLAIAAFAAALLATSASAQVNLGPQPSDPNLPFTVTKVATFQYPWRVAFLADGRMLVTEKPGALWLVTPEGAKTAVTGVPAVAYGSQGGLLGIYLSPTSVRSE